MTKLLFRQTNNPLESLALEETDLYICGKMKNTSSILYAGHLEVKEPGGAGICPLYKSPLGVKSHNFIQAAQKHYVL